VTERKPRELNVETWIDRQIREAQERGDFEDLPGRGKPLPGYGDQYREDWWLHGYLRREGVSSDTMLPAPLRLRKEIERLPEDVRPLDTEAEVREIVSELNERIVAYVRAGGGPRVPVAPVNADNVVSQWREHRAAARIAAPQPKSGPERPRHRWWFGRLRRKST
jgi:hypothetical protein